MEATSYSTARRGKATVTVVLARLEAKLPE
jgi:hypothetical protein